MKKIAIIGASGRTGRLLVEQTLHREISPACLVREGSGDKLPEDVSTIIGTPLKYEDVKNTVSGCEAVLCALNIARKSDLPWAAVVSPPNLLNESMKNIIKASKEEGVKRIITVSAWGVGDSYDEVNWLFRFLINKTKVGIAYTGHEEQEKLLQDSGLNWTSVRPVGLSNGKITDNLIVSHNGDKKLKMSISRADVAKFMLDILEDEKYFQTTPSISQA
ncbi:MAG: hypothetical protein D8M58_21660 [Calditrichaeota bacterium]|nr:MAG: hypothetical protein DWQ03_17125 [Calditrichota bacterium]MBL1208022.1 hypothetical protein [Calditrichota bacterium]NOG47858.1 NAD(P)H-binding protein [Calditrichota bacterium]